MTWADIGGHLKNVGAAVGAVTTLWVAYQASGLPMPATRQYVQEQVRPVITEIKSVSFAVLEGQLESMKTRKSQLRVERETIQNLLNSAKPETRGAIAQRMGEISDELSKIERQEQDIEDRLKEMKASKPNGNQQAG